MALKGYWSMSPLPFVLCLSLYLIIVLAHFLGHFNFYYCNMSLMNSAFTYICVYMLLSFVFPFLPYKEEEEKKKKKEEEEAKLGICMINIMYHEKG